ncbi:hypothetical protein VNO77_26858 [Canavalia gladiata]|uniref:Uncharacterized protein n=1 Tax=Canavalia gladiata TaxID=3824 RepID=A0AAN9KUB8_CANGL
MWEVLGSNCKYEKFKGRIVNSGSVGAELSWATGSLLRGDPFSNPSANLKVEWGSLVTVCRFWGCFECSMEDIPHLIWGWTRCDKHLGSVVFAQMYIEFQKRALMDFSADADQPKTSWNACHPRWFVRFSPPSDWMWDPPAGPVSSLCVRGQRA